MLFNIFEHPITTYIILVSTSNAKESSMICYYCSTELRNVVIEVNQILGLLMRLDVIEMNIFVTPFKVMNNSFVCELFLYNENILEKVNYSFSDIEMVEFSYHSFLIFQICFILVN